MRREAYLQTQVQQTDVAVVRHVIDLSYTRWFGLDRGPDVKPCSNDMTNTYGYKAAPFVPDCVLIDVRLHGRRLQQLWQQLSVEMWHVGYISKILMHYNKWFHLTHFVLIVM